MLQTSMSPTALYMHYDAFDNFVHVIDGWKEFLLFDPFQAAAVLYGSNQEHGNGSPINIDDPNVLSEYPLFRYAVPRCCRINAGEAVYVPLYWWHRVRSGSCRTLSLAHFSRGDPSKKDVIGKILCSASPRPARFECGGR